MRVWQDLASSPSAHKKNKHMAEVAFAFTFSVVGGRLQKRFRRSGLEEVMKINRTLDDMKELLSDADKKRDSDSDLKEWVAKARALGYRLEDVIDEFEISSWDVPKKLSMLIYLCIFGITVVNLFSDSGWLGYALLILSLIPVVLRVIPMILRPYLWLRQLKRIHWEVNKIRAGMKRFKLQSESRGEPQGRRFAGLENRFLAVSADKAVGLDTHLERLVEELGVTSDESGAVAMTAAERSDEASSSRELPSPVVVFISGDMGTGKTTLAARFFDQYQWYFEFSGWVGASQASSNEGEEAMFLRSILKSLKEGGVWEPDEYASGELTSEQLRGAITELLSNKSYLLVLDDVRPDQSWALAKKALPWTPGARIICTTRDQNWSAKKDFQGIRNHVLHPLSDKDAEALFLMTLGDHLQRPDQFELGEELKQVGRTILDKCQGLPLSIVTVASLLSTKEPIPEKWNKVLANLGGESASGTDASNRIIMSSGYSDLPPILKRCFLYCSVFPENYHIPTKRLMRLWLAEGFIDNIPGLTPEEAAESQLRQLIERHMLQVAKTSVAGEVTSCTVLWLMRSFFIDLNKQDLFCTVYTKQDDLPTSMDDLRRISVQITDNLKQVLEKSRKLRSILVFESYPPKRTFQAEPQSQLVGKFKLLRVLDLQGVKLITSAPTVLRSLTLLRYLSLRGTQIRNLQISLFHNMNQLQTLDIRETKVSRLPDLIGLTAIRHLLMSSSFDDKVVTVAVGIMWLRELQVLSGISLTKGTISEIAHLTQLKKLSAGEVHGEDSELVCEVVSRLTKLRSFTLKCRFGEEFTITKMKTLPHLNKLCLGGRFRDLLGWLTRHGSLTCLYIWDTLLEDDPLSALQRLPNLALLSLYNSYSGSQMKPIADQGFPKLKELSIQQMRGLKTWEPLTEGAMQSLQKLFISYCPELQFPPEGLEKVKTLEVVQIMEMPADFENTLRERRRLLNRENVFRVRLIPPTRLLGK